MSDSFRGRAAASIFSFALFVLSLAITSPAALAQDAAAPRVSSISRQNPVSERTTADTLAWRVTFNEPVASSGLLLGNTQSVLDGSGTFLQGIFMLAAADINGKTFVFAPSYEENGLSVLEISDQGIFQVAHNIADDETLFLQQASAASTHEIDGSYYLYTGSWGDDGISVFSIGNDGSLTNIQNIGDNATLQLDGVSDFHIATVSSTEFMFVPGRTDWGVSVFQIGSDGMLTPVFDVNDSENSDYELAGARSITSAMIDGTTYLYVAGGLDHGISVFFSRRRRLPDTPSSYSG